MDRALWTIGHSNHPIERFIELLRGQRIELLADVRRFPSSRAHPHFNEDALRDSLAADGVEYGHFPALGGRRNKRRPDSPNNAWRVAAFNAFADHLQSKEFQTAFAELLSLAQARRAAIMCAEALPWQCHRRIIADALVAQGWTVHDIMPDGKPRPHELPDFAQVENGSVTYPQSLLF
jgi:uncharacterized protein (DUF488 family)